MPPAPSVLGTPVHRKALSSVATAPPPQIPRGKIAPTPAPAETLPLAPALAPAVQRAGLPLLAPAQKANAMATATKNAITVP